MHEVIYFLILHLILVFLYSSRTLFFIEKKLVKSRSHMSTRVQFESRATPSIAGQFSEAPPALQARPPRYRVIHDSFEDLQSQTSFFSRCSDLFSKAKNTFFRFLKWVFSSCLMSPKRLHSRGDLTRVFEETHDALETGSYTAPSGRIVRLDIQDMQINTRIYHELADLSPSPLPRINDSLDDSSIRTNIQVVNRDSLAEGLRLKREHGYKVAVINFANEDHPGGSVRRGARGQEEAISRSTGLIFSIDPNINTQLHFPGGSYNIPEQGVIFSPDVPVFRKSEEEGFEWMENPQTISIISSAAYHPGNRPRNFQEYERRMVQKIRIQFATAIAHGCDAVVSGAYGCGAFQNRPEDVSRWTREVLSDFSLRGALQHISFAVYAPPESQRDQHNLRVFNEAFRGACIHGPRSYSFRP